MIPTCALFRTDLGEHAAHEEVMLPEVLRQKVRLWIRVQSLVFRVHKESAVGVKARQEKLAEELARQPAAVYACLDEPRRVDEFNFQSESQ